MMKGFAKKDNDVLVEGIDETISGNVPQTNETKEVEVPVQRPIQEDKKIVNDKVVTIRVNSNHKCHIGGTYYVFEKLKVYQVPADVKRILFGAGLLAPL